MLNRRILRIKVMQTIYALKQSEQSNYHAGLDYIKEVFLPDLNSEEKQDTVKLEEKRKKASGIYERCFEDSLAFAEEDDVIRKTVETAIKDYHKEVEKDKRNFKKQMVTGVDKIETLYIRIFNLLLDTFNISPLDTKAPQSPLATLINKNKSITQNTGTREDVVTKLQLNKTFKDFLKKDAEVAEYLADAGGLEADKKLAQHLVKNLIMKDKVLEVFFEDYDLDWLENKSIVKNMALKTLKNTSEANEELPLMELSSNWEEDKEFFTELFDSTLANEKQLEEVVHKKLKNWDVERLAMVDLILLKMALSEMIHFSSIPVKVTINEYIELSKLYSTPKSKQFINGILDSTSAELMDSGIIKKSGRGLIDNK